MLLPYYRIEKQYCQENDSEHRNDDLDVTVEEFTKAVEEEQELEDQGAFSKEPNNEEKTQKKPMSKSLSNAYQAYKKDVRKFHNLQPKDSTATSKDTKTDMVSEILRRFPNILKDNKQAKIKGMVKDSDGKSRMQIITLKSQGAVNSPALTSARNESRLDGVAERKISENVRNATPPLATDQNVQTTSTSVSDNETLEAPVAGKLLTGALGLRSIPKVKYTGKRGRPKKVQPGEVDPHADVRKEIEERLQKAAGIGQTLVIESTGFNSLEGQDHLTNNDGHSIVTLDQSTIAQTLTDPSSEAEALSNVASGIATSLGLVANASNEQASNEQTIINTQQAAGVGPLTNSGPLADLEHFEGGAVGDGQPDLSQHTNTSSETNHIKKGSPMKNLKGINSNRESKTSKAKEIEMDWEDGDEEESELSMP